MIFSVIGSVLVVGAVEVLGCWSGGGLLEVEGFQVGGDEDGTLVVL